MSASYDLMNKFGAITHGSSCAQSHSRSMAIGRTTRGGCLCTFWEAFHPCNSWKLVKGIWNHLISFSSVRRTFRSFWDPWSILVFSRAHNMKALLFQTPGSTFIPSSVLRETTKQSRATSINWWDPDILVRNMSMGIFGSSQSPPVFFMSAEGQNLPIDFPSWQRP